MKLFLSLLFFSSMLFAEAIDTHSFGDEVLQKRYNTLIKDIRCPVCQGQSIGGSNAPLAQDLRAVVATMLNQGRSDDEIFKFMTDRYGDFAVFSPPMNYTTYLLWLGPFVFALLTLIFFVRNKSSAPIEEDKQDISKVEELLKD